MKTSTATLLLMIEQGECNGFQSTEWFVNDKLVLSTGTNEPLPNQIELTVEMPCELRVKIDGKNINSDTKVVDGQIVQDKFIKLKQAYLARYPIKEHLLHELCEYTDDTGVVHHNQYWHRNGEVKIQLESNDPIIWHFTKNT
jgi:hypothetical protein